MDADGSKPCCGGRSWWRLPLMLALVLGAIVLWRGRNQWETSDIAERKVAPRPASSETNERVLLSVDYGNGKLRIIGPRPWHRGMTVGDLLGSVPGLAITQKGKGEGAFLVEVDGVANEGADGKNWAYEVNGVSADRSFGVYELQPGDRVLWRFGPSR